MRRRRRIISHQIYELTIRAAEGLPFPPLDIIKLLILSATARSNRHNNVTIMHYVWMSNHLHMLVLSRDREAFDKFYMELKRKLTEYIKRLLGRRVLRLWEFRVGVTHIADLPSMEDRIRYFYNNPSKAHLVNSIDEYPGLSSWRAFNELPADIDAKHQVLVPWIHYRDVPELGSALLSASQDENLVRIIKKSCKELHALILQPHAWMKIFHQGDSDDIAASKERIIARIRHFECTYQEERNRAGRKPLGRSRLVREAIMKHHIPERSGRTPFVIASDPVRRLELINSHKEFCALCAWAYEQYYAGNRLVEWPPGAYLPPLRPLYNVLPDY